MRLIDATKVVQDILAERDKIPLRVPCAPYELLDDKPNAIGQAQRGGIRKALRCIEEAPTIEAEVVKHGRWENVGDMVSDLCFRCSNCKEEYSCEIDMNTFAKYCPNCGAKMISEE